MEHFIQILAEHYGNANIIDSVLLGISGNWGESIFPANGCMIGGFHTHQGWWCGDQYARANFSTVMMVKYGSLDNVNDAWGTGFKTLKEICFPDVGKRPLWLRNFLGFVWQYQPYWLKSRINLARSVFAKTQKADVKALCRWLDFVDWYMDSMTKWSEFWLKTARHHIPDLPVTLVTGGNGGPRMGADFTAQAKLAGRYDSGMRITNQTDDYLSSFVITRLMSAACRYYGADYSTEEAAINSETGIIMRIFDAATSGASSIYFKRLIGLGYDKYTRTFVPSGELSSSAVNFEKYEYYLQQRRPVVDIAVFYPSRAIKIQESIQHPLFDFLQRLRETFDYDLIDERMVIDEALSAYRFFVLSGDNLVNGTVCSSIQAWIRGGGILWVPQNSNNTWHMLEHNSDVTLGTAAPIEKVYKIEKGYVVVSGKDENEITLLTEFYFNQNGKYPWQPTQVSVIPQKGVFYSRVEDDRLIYDSSENSIRFESSQK